MFDLSKVVRMYDEDGITYFEFNNGDYLKILPDYSHGDGETFQRYFHFEKSSGRWSEINRNNIR